MLLEENNLMMWLAISVMFNVLVLFFLFFTKIGIEIFKRFRNKIVYKRGHHVNTLMILKTGLMKELFIKKEDDGSFKYDNKVYVTVPQMRMPYKDIPSFIHLEGKPDPIDIFDNDSDGLLSSAEMDEVMLAANNFDLLDFIKRWTPLLLIVVAVIIGAVLLGAYFNFNVYQMLRDGTYESVVNSAVALAPK